MRSIEDIQAEVQKIVLKTKRRTSLQGPVCRQLSPQTRNTGCGTQQLLRIRLHLAGRGSNNSSLFPPLAAVTVVANHSIARPIAYGNRGPTPADGLRRKLPTRRLMTAFLT